jgi:ureidoglycolate hydrolase
MTRRIDIPVRPLTPEAFARFGHVLAPRPVRDFGSDLTDVHRFPWSADAPVRVQMLRYRRKPLDVAQIERHLHVTEARFHTGGPAAAIVVARPGETPPAPEDLVAFALDGQGVMFHIGTWHGLHAYPLAEGDSDFLFLSDAATQAELFDSPVARPERTQTHDYARAGIEVRLIAEEGGSGP